jgi:hypothetical protein
VCFYDCILSESIKQYIWASGCGRYKEWGTNDVGIGCDNFIMSGDYDQLTSGVAGIIFD